MRVSSIRRSPFLADSTASVSSVDEAAEGTVIYPWGECKALDHPGIPLPPPPPPAKRFRWWRVVATAAAALTGFLIPYEVALGVQAGT